MIIMDEDEYLSKHNVLYPMSGFCLDKLRGNRMLKTESGRKKFNKECDEAEKIYQEKREHVRQEYRELVQKGELKPRTGIERSLIIAKGHPDNPSVQAARRICEKRGYDWKTGQKLTNKGDN